ncbi:HipA domain-containing protein [Arcanobacterium ihumii]|uniref:HipA domain-containing protein n=1 Tax=Arcanobacterium ihumii TaxID=2138162 RepID=UPI000F54B5EC|nr:HipA domain-containing protein [Arcanobacterium ihumii]
MFSISLNMPVKVGGYENAVVEPFLAGFCPIVNRKGAQMVPLLTSDIAQRLKELHDGNEPSWISKNEHWSLAGAQEKFALHRSQFGGQWYQVTGSVPSTHILKPGILNLKAQAFVEVLSMKTIQKLGIEAATTWYESFDGEVALVSERWDRKVKSGVVHRILQEDLCQAMGYLPSDKYESVGGPSVRDIAVWLTHNGFGTEDVKQFARALIVNYLLCATDAHAKNYAVYWEKGT